MNISQKFNCAKYKEFIAGWQQQDKFLALLKLLLSQGSTKIVHALRIVKFNVKCLQTSGSLRNNERKKDNMEKKKDSTKKLWETEKTLPRKIKKRKKSNIKKKIRIKF